MSEKQNKNIEKITVYVKDLGQNKVKLKLEPDATFEDLLIALKKSEGTEIMKSVACFELFFESESLSKKLKGQDFKQIKISDLNIKDCSTLMFLGRLFSREDGLFSWADIKSADKKNLTDGWTKKPNAIEIINIDLVDVNRVVGQKVMISLNKTSSEKHKQVNANINDLNNLKTESSMFREKENTVKNQSLLNNEEKMLKSDAISEKSNGRRSFKSFFLWIFELFFRKPKTPVETEISSKISGPFPKNNLIQETKNVPDISAQISSHEEFN